MRIKELLDLHIETTEKCRKVMESKNSDYTGGAQATDALANFKAAQTLGMHPVMGLLLRMQDKIQRVRSFVADGSLRVSGETVEDAFEDMVNYAILGKALIKEEATQINCNNSVEDELWEMIDNPGNGSYIPEDQHVEVRLPASDEWIKACYFTPGYIYRKLKSKSV
jgi:hypothetical protein